ncbi:GAF domain-containing protein [Luteolibacter pohnpeiensis]|uniref:GAF domain-containing protein n=1 Tax=Luteolibacter pohnpeiensis TaxID=454153 RepID=A0A934SAC3_9BACT|nr:GAF domain-containing protein [Luteolibacter pohnpeiensis]MBK1883801.1 GAF domain-containing protein [Luteolibacter pohnpeiensis]
MSDSSVYQSYLTKALQHFDCQSGTIHKTDLTGEFLDLVAAVGIPESLMDKVTRIPFGKGIAGVAAQTREPVELCNLQQDLGGVAKAGARATGVSGSLAVPIFSADGAKVIGTLGVGKYTPYDFSDEEKQQLAKHAEEIASAFSRD